MNEPSAELPVPVAADPATTATADADYPPMVIVIATCGRQALLDRLLRTLANCAQPANLRRVIVAENGTKYDAEQVAERFRTTLPIDYRYSPQPNKSRALNEALATVPDDEFVVFFDDDVRVHREVLVGYAEALRGHRAGIFLGGRCLVDYDDPPPAWLKPYFPPSARGWSLGDAVTPLTEPQALGFNWGAFAGDVRAVGGFDEETGPGTTRGIDDETSVQRRLLETGVKGYFLPTATVWHYVPKERCSESWALKRAQQNGYARGLVFGTVPTYRIRARRRYGFRLLRLSLLLAFAGGFVRRERLFHYRYWRQRHRGMLQGLKAAARAARPRRESPA